MSDTKAAGGVRLPSETRYLAAACAAFGLAIRDISGEGYLLEVSDGARTLALAAGRACIYPTNSAAAFTLTKDKMHTARLLAAHGLPTLGGELFFVTDHHRQHRGHGLERADAIRYAEQHGYPLFAKPNTGARGDLAEIVRSRAGLERLMAEAATRYDAILLQDVVEGPEMRVFCLGGEVMFAVARASAGLTGDGRSTLAELIAAHNAALAGSGISPVPPDALQAIGREEGLLPDAIIPGGRAVPIPGRRNLAAAGRAERLIDPLPEEAASLALDAARITGLHVAGVDLIDTGRAAAGGGGNGGDGGLAVMEVNGAPGMTALEQLGRMDLVIEIWRRMLSQAFGRDLSCG